MAEDDRLVQDYLRRLRRAARRLPRARRRELLDEIAGHIAEARAAGQGSAPVAGADGVGAVLARLGAPGDIVRAAGGPRVSRPGALEITAVILLLMGGFLFVVGWVAGCVLLWVSPRWRWTDKLLGTLVWPGGLFAVWYVVGIPAGSGACGGTGNPPTCPSAGPPPWVGIAILVVLLLAPLVVAVWLLRRVGRLPGQDVTEWNLTRVP